MYTIILLLDYTVSWYYFIVKVGDFSICQSTPGIANKKLKFKIYQTIPIDLNGKYARDVLF